MDARVSCIFIIFGAPERLFKESSVVGGIENENESERVGLDMFYQHRKVSWAEFTRLR